VRLVGEVLIAAYLNVMEKVKQIHQRVQEKGHVFQKIHAFVKIIGLVHNVIFHSVLDFLQMILKLAIVAELVLMPMFAIAILDGEAMIVALLWIYVMEKVQQILQYVQDMDHVYRRTSVNANKIGLGNNVISHYALGLLEMIHKFVMDVEIVLIPICVNVT